VPASWDVSNFRPRPRRTVVKNLSIMLPVLPVRLTRAARVLPTVVPRRPGPRVRLVLPARKAPRRVHQDLAGLVARVEPDVRADFRAPAARPAPVDRVVVLVVRPVRVALAARPVALAAPPVRA
jgi:hypothetical protein